MPGYAHLSRGWPPPEAPGECPTKSFSLSKTLATLLATTAPVGAQFGSCASGIICYGQGGAGGTPPGNNGGGNNGGGNNGGGGNGGGNNGGGNAGWTPATPEPPILIPGGGGSPPPARPPSVFDYWCVPDTTGAGLCPEMMDVTLYCNHSGCYVVHYACKTAEACQRTTTTPEVQAVEWPCTPGFGAGGVYMQCAGDEYNGFDWGYYLQVWAEVPGHSAQIRPFPRWLVNEAGMLCLSRSPGFSMYGGPTGAGSSEGFWSQKVTIPPNRDYEQTPPDEGDIKDYHIGVRWRLLNPGESLFGGPAVKQSCWYFNEREWSENAPMACGDCVTHVYDASPYGLPENGPTWAPENEGCEKVPSDSGEWTNPAYQVAVPTYWVAEWANEWEAWELVGWEAGGCFYTESPAAGTQGCASGDHAGEANWYQTQGEPVYGWVHYFVGWEPIDLREVGAAGVDGMWYYTSWAVRTTGQGAWCAAEYGDPNPGVTVRVPVIEVQAVTVEDCRVTGDCGDLNPADAGDLPEPPTPPTPVPTPPPGGGGGGGEEDECPFCPPCP
ncbi:MAG TPA: hypothetical protein PKH77_26500 [Anaerolineae bacterium]|nr:hypothetical protein [Anaerolineae bacterium]